MQAILVLLGTMDDSHQLQVQAEPTAKKIIESPRSAVRKQYVGEQTWLLSNYFNYQRDPNDSISQHFGKLKEHRVELEQLGELQSDDMFQAVLLNSLPSEFSETVKAWDMCHPGMKTTEFLITKLFQRIDPIPQH